MTIRPATVVDVPAVLPMVAKICAFHEQLDPAKYPFRPNPADMYAKWLPARATDPRYTATQLALFTSLAAVPRTVVNASTGWIV